MTERIKNLLDATFSKKQKAFRRDVDWKPLLDGFIANGVDDSTRARMGLVEMLKAETPAFMEGETIAFTRTVNEIGPERLRSLLARRESGLPDDGQLSLPFDENP